MVHKAILIAFACMAQVVQADPLACVIEPEKIAELGSAAIGIIDKISVDRGDHVKAGQVVASLKSDVERASVQVATARAQGEAELKAAIAAQNLAEAKLVRARNLVQVGFISKEAIDQAEADARIAQNRVIQAEDSKRIAKHELELSSSQLAQRSIRSPFAGIVVDRYRTEGERIEREPIVRIAKIDPLRVEVVVSLAQFGQIVPGAKASIKTDVTGAKSLTGTVVLVDRVIDAASNTFRVRLVLPNPDGSIPAGLRCNVDFGVVASGHMQVPSDKGGIVPASLVKAASSRTDPRGRLSYELQHSPKSN